MKFKMTQKYMIKIMICVYQNNMCMKKDTPKNPTVVRIKTSRGLVI